MAGTNLGDAASTWLPRVVRRIGGVAGEGMRYESELIPMENTRAKHPALAFLVSLSVAGTCLAAPGLALAAPSSAQTDEPAEAAAAEGAAAASTETAEPAQGTDEAAISNPELKGAEEAAADADEAAEAERAKDAVETADADAPATADKAASDTKDIKVDSGSISFGGVTVAVPDSFIVMDFPHLMTLAVAPTGEMSVTLASPAMVMVDEATGEAGPELFDDVAESLAEAAGVETPDVQKLALADGTEAYEYIFDLVDPESGEPVASNAAVYMVFVPVDDSYTVVQVTVDRMVADVSQDTVDSIISSIAVGASDKTATETEAATSDAKPAEVAEPESATDEAAISNPELKGAEEAAADADKAAETEEAARAADQAKTTDDADKTDDAASPDAAEKADQSTDATATDADDADQKDDATATDAAPAAGTTESFAGMSFDIPAGLSATDESSDQQGIWTDESGDLVVRVTPNVVDSVQSMTLRDLTREAYGLASSLNGEVVGYATYENDDTTVYTYAIVFERDGVEQMGTVGYVPVADGSLSAISCAFPLSDMDAYAPTVESIYESVSVAE